MGYGAPGLEHLMSLLSRVPPDGALLELGAQNINADVPRDAISRALHAIHGCQIPSEALGKFDRPGPWWTADLFRGSRHRYRCIDLYPGDFTIVADLNTLRVPDVDKGQFHLITNQGTSEHVADQMNLFRAVHDYAAVGATMLHAVPFTGYYNHGLYSYHPLFFVFLAHANDYEIEYLGMSDAHFPFTIPENSCAGAAAWSKSVMQSGIVMAILRKAVDVPYRLFTDYDQAEMGRIKIAEPWASVIRERYDLRIRT
jgi:hypothetical protein